jgi:hypothetical protein
MFCPICETPFVVNFSLCKRCELLVENIRSIGVERATSILLMSGNTDYQVSYPDMDIAGNTIEPRGIIQDKPKIKLSPYYINDA